MLDRNKHVRKSAWLGYDIILLDGLLTENLVDRNFFYAVNADAVGKLGLNPHLLCLPLKVLCVDCYLIGKTLTLKNGVGVGFLVIKLVVKANLLERGNLFDY
jgi:hypothetical protein